MVLNIFSAGDPVLESEVNENFENAIKWLFGDGSDGDVTISSNTSLSSDIYYDNLTVNTGITLTTNGYRVFVKNKLTVNGTVDFSGNDGGNGGNGGTGASAGSAGSAGSALNSNNVHGAVAGIAGQAGAYGGSNSAVELV